MMALKSPGFETFFGDGRRSSSQLLLNLGHNTPRARTGVTQRLAVVRQHHFGNRQPRNGVRCRRDWSIGRQVDVRRPRRRRVRVAWPSLSACWPRIACLGLALQLTGDDTQGRCNLEPMGRDHQSKGDYSDLLVGPRVTLRGSFVHVEGNQIPKSGWNRRRDGRWTQWQPDSECQQVTGPQSTEDMHIKLELQRLELAKPTVMLRGGVGWPSRRPKNDLLFADVLPEIIQVEIPGSCEPRVNEVHGFAVQPSEKLYLNVGQDRLVGAALTACVFSWLVQVFCLLIDTICACGGAIHAPA